jgi:ribosomal-protein-alanine N-acetyltransferase
MIRRDMRKVLEIEKQCFPEYPWNENNFISFLRNRNCIGMVIHDLNDPDMNDPIMGYMIYELHKNKLVIINLGVDPKYRRKGVGTQLINKLISKLSPDRRKSLIAEVRESNLAGQLFFKSNKFRAVSIDKAPNWDEECDEDSYVMQYLLLPNGGIL